VKIAALAGGVGGARMADGLAQCLAPEDLTVVVNTGDDFEHFGLTICPDLDTVCYTLAGLGNPETGWGRLGDTFHALEAVGRLGGETWFTLGDRDLATHLERTRRLRLGQPLSQITRDFCAAWGVQPAVLPMSDSKVRTRVDTVESGELPFQEYFVRRRCEPRVRGFRFAGIESAGPAPGVEEALGAAEAVVICPSNPWVSVDPILAVLGSLFTVHRPPAVIAVSPIIGGKAVKGPAAKMFAELGFEASALAVREHYGGLLTGFVLDRLDAALASQTGLPTLVTDTLMTGRDERRRLAEDVLHWMESI
jgi:LPPG:FO 2-phospho-L-lactate transferase